MTKAGEKILRGAREAAAFAAGEMNSRAVVHEHWLKAFVRESNRIEGILREPEVHEVEAHVALLAVKTPVVEDIEAFVAAVQPGARLRDRRGFNVCVGNHVPPPGGPEIREQLGALLAKGADPWRTHVEYETLHPFTDGNGRSGRALWLWQMMRLGGRHEAQAQALGFLHAFYYQTLANDPLREAQGVLHAT